MNRFHESIRNEANGVRLSAAERARMRARLVAHMEARPAAVPSPWAGLFAFSVHPARAAIAVFLCVAVVGSGTAYAAERALPGDALYAVKVGVNEPVAGALAVSAQAKASWHAGVAEERASEAERLLASGRLDAGTSEKLADDFDAHAGAAGALTATLRSDDPAAASRLSSRFSASLAARSTAILDEGASQDDAEAREAAGSFVQRLLANRAGHLALMDRADNADHRGAAGGRAKTAAKQPPAVPETADAVAETMATASLEAGEASATLAVSLSAPAPVAKMFVAPREEAASDSGEEKGETADKDAADTAASAEMNSVKTADAAALDDAIARAAAHLDALSDSLDPVARAEAEEQLADLRLVPLVVRADEAVGDSEGAARARAAGLDAAAALEASLDAHSS